MLFFIYTTFIVPLTVLFPVYYAFKNYAFLNRALKIILAFLIFSSVMNTISSVMGRVFHMHTIVIFHIYTPFEFAFLISFFAEFYNKRTRYVMYGIAAAFAVFCVLSTMFIQDLKQMDSYPRSIDAIVLIACCMLFFFKNNNDLDRKWSSFSTNWIVAGILLYYSSSLFMFIFFDKMLNAGIMTMIIMVVYASILIVEYILFAIGFKKCRPQQTISTSK